MTNPNDFVRDAILRHLYKVHQKARSPRKASIGIRELHSAMKELGYKQQHIGSNLDYLMQVGWVVQVSEPRTFTTKSGTVRSEPRITYKISASGIDYIEGASIYKKKDYANQVNIENIGGVTIVGDGNIVNTALKEMAGVLETMRKGILSSASLSPEQKLSIVSDLDGLRSQIQKPAPNKTAVGALWKAIAAAASMAGFEEFVERGAEMLGQLLE